MKTVIACPEPEEPEQPLTVVVMTTANPSLITVMPPTYYTWGRA